MKYLPLTVGFGESQGCGGLRKLQKVRNYSQFDSNTKVKLYLLLALLRVSLLITLGGP